jgi:hypothetical protein
MSVPADRVSRVVIAGEWFSVELGTFEVLDLEFLDEQGEPLHDPVPDKAYRFTTPDQDTYYGPLSAIQLVKILEL